MFKWLRTLFGRNGTQAITTRAEISDRQVSDGTPIGHSLRVGTALADAPQPRQPFESNVYRFSEMVLDRLYSELSLKYGENTDELVVGACRDLHRELRPLGGLSKGDKVRYDTDLRRFAYLYAFAPEHARAIQNILMRNAPISAPVERLFQNKHIKVVCIGGGPGSELVGLMDHLSRTGQTPSIAAVICDRETGWRQCWRYVEAECSKTFDFKAQYNHVDVLDPSSWTSRHEYEDADLYLVSYCTSEVYSKVPDTEAFFSHLLQQASSGALFLFADASMPQYYNWIDHLPFNWALLRANHNVVPDWDDGELDVAHEQYRGRLRGFFPGMSPRYAYRIFQKP